MPGVTRDILQCAERVLQLLGNILQFLKEYFGSRQRLSISLVLKRVMWFSFLSGQRESIWGVLGFSVLGSALQVL